jgi:hypothetical protein
VVLNLAASDTPSPTTDESPAAFLDPSIPDWMTIARLPNACRFRIENAIEAVFDVRTRPVSLTSPSSPAGSVCQFWRSDAGSDPNPEAWLGNLHAYPPADGELPSMFNQMGQEGSLMNVDFRDVMVSNCGSPAGCQGCECDLDILIGHEAATLWVILRLDNLDETSGDVERFVGAVLSEMDAWAAQQ